ncbi:MAG: lasso peptide biosynthesis B2 protein [Paludibacterium sp.]|uniref:lasso peptide biosynthesis B2 protein n=1 Tax=Paludibacterium sp. TaxID=1917523 RepID=UPI0025E27712|nr:lasso peptide biosynthesis B2 protein [Paludibacterium sp.]MBV8047723.1 lasso peptide biosynthesis B2 protein [Paludibacterium sp.]MBV8648304.1 lasso peptide biosynthesis B2 protein [Paludibacterium sp.]
MNSTYFRFCDHIHHLFVGEQLILLDARRDRYIFIAPPVSTSLLQALTQQTPESALSETIAVALSRKVLRRCDHPVAIRQTSGHPVGIGLHEWQSSEEPLTIPPYQRVCVMGYFTVVTLQIRLFGLNRLLQNISQFARNATRTADVEVSGHIANKVRHCSRSLPFRTACLENALVTAVLLARHALPFQFRIGFQLDPFLAHAWLNVDGQVLLDRPDLNQAMHILVNLP